MKRPKQNPKLKNVQNYWHKKGWEDREKFLPSKEEILCLLLLDPVQDWESKDIWATRKSLEIHKRLTEGEED